MLSKEREKENESSSMCGVVGSIWKVLEEGTVVRVCYTKNCLFKKSIFLKHKRIVMDWFYLFCHQLIILFFCCSREINWRSYVKLLPLPLSLPSGSLWTFLIKYFWPVCQFIDRLYSQECRTWYKILEVCMNIATWVCGGEHAHWGRKEKLRN